MRGGAPALGCPDRGPYVGELGLTPLVGAAAIRVAHAFDVYRPVRTALRPSYCVGLTLEHRAGALGICPLDLVPPVITALDEQRIILTHILSLPSGPGWPLYRQTHVRPRWFRSWKASVALDLVAGNGNLNAYRGVLRQMAQTVSLNGVPRKPPFRASLSVGGPSVRRQRFPGGSSSAGPRGPVVSVRPPPVVMSRRSAIACARASEAPASRSAVAPWRFVAGVRS